MGKITSAKIARITRKKQAKGRHKTAVEREKLMAKNRRILYGFI
jgi:hypothetical protein